MEFILTTKGMQLQAKIQSGKNIVFTKAAAAAGYSVNPKDLMELIDKKQEGISLHVEVREENIAELQIFLSNVGITHEYKLKQMGIYALDPDTKEEILYIVGQDEHGELIHAESQQLDELKYFVSIQITELSEAIIEVNGTELVTKSILTSEVNRLKTSISELKTSDTKDNIVTFTEASTRSNIATGEKHSILMGKIKKWFSDLRALAFKDKVGTEDLDTTLKANINSKFETANVIQSSSVSDASKVASAAVTYNLQQQITGLKTSDTKDNSVTFTEASTRSNIVTGEKHNILMGKIKKWFSDLRALAFKDKVAAADLEATLKAYIDSKFTASNIIHNTEVADMSKVASAAVTHNLQQQITQLNQNLTLQMPYVLEDSFNNSTLKIIDIVNGEISTNTFSYGYFWDGRTQPQDAPSEIASKKIESWYEIYRNNQHEASRTIVRCTAHINNEIKVYIRFYIRNSSLFFPTTDWITK